MCHSKKVLLISDANCCRTLSVLSLIDSNVVSTVAGNLCKQISTIPANLKLINSDKFNWSHSVIHDIYMCVCVYGGWWQCPFNIPWHHINRTCYYIQKTSTKKFNVNRKLMLCMRQLMRLEVDQTDKITNQRKIKSNKNNNRKSIQFVFDCMYRLDAIIGNESGQTFIILLIVTNFH